MNLTVSEFYRNACETKQVFAELVHDQNKGLAFYGVLKEVCQSLVRGNFSEENLISSLEKAYDASFFAFPWQREIQIKDDAKKVTRFVSAFKDETWLGFSVPVTVQTGKNQLSTAINLIYKTKDNRYGAIILHPGKADKSQGGKSLHTNTKTDLFLMTAKAALEEKYPGILCTDVFLSNKEDTAGNIGPWKEGRTMASNVFTESFEEYYRDGKFLRKDFLEKMDEVISSRPEPDCYNCFQKEFCSAEDIFSMSKQKAQVAPEDESGYHEPTYTAKQEEAVRHKDGPILVLAGPGSGKTSVVCGHGEYLMKEGVDPEFITCVTFTTKAAQELSGRFTALGGESPVCSTIHALARKILVQNKGIIGREIKPLDRFTEGEIIGNLLDDLDTCLTGFRLSGGNAQEMRNSYISSVVRAVEDYQKDPEGYQKKNPKVGDDFFSLTKEFKDIAVARGFVTFDGLIDETNALFKEHPEVLEAQAAMIKYLLVDEFQDVDRAQALMLYTIARANGGNIMVVGDDDQSIYGFRGGSNRYMREFPKTFPGAKVVQLDKNFRSSGEIVSVSRALIAKNKERIKKTVTSTRGNGAKPVVLSGQTPSDIASAVNEARKCGFSYEEMAVLASKNKTLSDIAHSVAFPNVLGKALLTESAIFGILLDILEMALRGVSDRPMAHYLTVMGLHDIGDMLPVHEGIVSALKAEGYLLSGDKVNPKKDTDGPEGVLYDALSKAFREIELIRGKAAAFYVLDDVVATYDMEGTSAAEALEKVLEDRHIRSTENMFEALSYMAEFGDETRLEPVHDGAVLLITSHEAKGMEWPVVILVDDFKTDGSEETNRLYYVAVTRAKDRLFVLKKPGSRTLIEEALAS